MSEEAPPQESGEPERARPARRHPGWRRPVAWGAGVVAGLAVVLAISLAAINTGPGRAFLVERLAGMHLKSGLNVRIARIDGSLYGRMVIRGLEVRDPKGPFMTAPAVTVDWRPASYLRRNLVVREASAPAIRLIRRPQLKKTPPDPDRPLLPNINLAVGSLRVDALTIEPAVTGRRHLLGLKGSADLADGRLRLLADVLARSAPGIAGGDRLAARVDILPKANRLLIDARLDAPTGGVVDSLAKLGAPLQAQISGRGDWDRWDGVAAGRLGAAPLADLRISARKGVFGVTGQVMPHLVVKGQPAHLLTPAVAVDLAATVGKKRKVQTRLSLRSEAFDLAANGGVDLAANRFDDLHIMARLLKPGAIAANLSGRDVQMALVLEGRFGQPRVDYDLSAGTLAFGATTIESLKAAGRTVVDPKRTLIPIHATARRVTGLNAAAGGLLTNIRLDGDLAIGGGRILSDNLRLRSDRVDSTLVLVADLAAGRYTAALKGRVNDYDIASVGRLDLVTDAKLVSGANGGFGMKGRIEVRTRRLYNEAVRTFLGGNATISADVGLDEAGVITVSGLRVTAPEFRLSGGGSYAPDGRIAFRASAHSNRYGPLGLAASGTADRPVLHLTAASPNVGVQLRDVRVDVVGVGGAYKVAGQGLSPYGGFAGDLTVSPGKPLTIDIASFRLADLTVRGRIVQSSAGPFTGALDLSGSGLSGGIRLGAVGRVQSVDADVRAQNARLPLQPATTVGSGALRARAVLYPKAPAITADVRVVNLQQGLLAIANAQGRLRYQNGGGTMGVTAQGRRGAPFNIAAQAALSPDLIRANLRGTVGTAPVRLAAPARIRKVRDGWRLEPATLVLRQGQVDVSGRTGTATEVSARLRNVDLSLVQAFAPSLGLTGTATGIVEFSEPRGAAVPTATARLQIARFSRVGLATASPPVDIALRGSLSGSGGDVRAVIRRGGGVIGRLQARLAPLPAGGGAWSNRLMQAPLSGGVRYSGPADVLWAMTGISGQQVSGPVAVAADFAGRVSKPSLNGVIRADALRYENTSLGTVISNIAVRGRFTQSRLEIASLTGRAGRGSIAGSGTVGLDAGSGFPMDVRVRLDRAQLAGSDAVAATVSGTIAVTNNRTQGAAITGDLTIPEARYQIVRQGAADVPQLQGVRRRNQAPPAAASATAAEGGLPANWKLNIRVRAPNRLFVTGMGLDSEWRSDLRVTGTANAPRVVGELEVVRGTFNFAGRRLEITNGDVRFDGGQLTQPELDITASATVQSVTASVNITGRAQNPQISFSSTPALPQDEILARLLFGNSAGSLSPVQAIQLAASLNTLRGGGGGLNPLGKLRSATGLSGLRVVTAAGGGAGLAAGRYITSNIYLEVVTDARGFTATQLEIALSRSLSILSQFGSFGGSSVDLRYSRDY